MTAERPQLTREGVIQAVARVETGEGSVHPVISVINSHLSRIQLLNSGFPQSGSKQEQDRYTDTHYGFLADALIASESYTLEPLDVIIIWSRAMRDLPHTRYSLAAMVSSAYAIQGLDNPAWRRFPRYYHQHNADLDEPILPQELSGDKTGLIHVRERLGHVWTSISAIHSFRVRAHQELWQEACSRAGKSTVRQGVIFRMLWRDFVGKAGELDEIEENFGGKFIPMVLNINDALEALEYTESK